MLCLGFFVVALPDIGKMDRKIFSKSINGLITLFIMFQQKKRKNSLEKIKA